MAVLKHLSKRYIQRTFTHKAWFMGIVPVYINVKTLDVAVRNGVPDFLFDVVETAGYFVRRVMGKVKRGYEQQGDFLFTGTINKDGK